MAASASAFPFMASMQTSITRTSQSPQQQQKFEPSHFEVRGLVKNFKNLEVEGLIKQEVEAWIGSLILELNGDAERLIDMPATNIANFKIFHASILSKVFPGGAWPLRAHAARVLQSDLLKVRGNTLSVSVEDAPWVKPTKQGGGKALSVLITLGLTPSHVRCDYKVNPRCTIFHEPPGIRAYSLMTLSEAEGYAINIDNLVKAGVTHTSEAIMSRLNDI